jgi:hypothetical protein
MTSSCTVLRGQSPPASLTAVLAGLKIADVLEPLPFVRLDVLELLLDHVVAVEEVAQVDAAALAEAVGVVGL